jgi:hypothetical protein
MIYIIIFLVFALLVAIFYCAKFAFIIIDIQESVEKSLEILDDQYDSISKILEIPIFHDSREVRKVIYDIDLARESIIDVAKKLSLQNIEEEE